MPSINIVIAFGVIDQYLGGNSDTWNEFRFLWNAAYLCVFSTMSQTFGGARYETNEIFEIIFKTKKKSFL